MKCDNSSCPSNHQELASATAPLGSGTVTVAGLGITQETPPLQSHWVSWYHTGPEESQVNVILQVFLFKH